MMRNKPGSALSYLMEDAMNKPSILAAALAALSLSTGAWAFQGHGGHSSGSHISGGVRHFESSHFAGPHFHSGPRVFIGGAFYAPFYYPPYYYDPYYYAPPPPVEYVQPAPQQQYWYYCGSARAYYPYVQNCPEGWQQVVPQPQ